SRQGPTKSYLFLLAVLAPAGLPGSFADLCTRAAPFHPEEPNDCSCPLLHRQFQTSSSLADWPLLFSVTRPKTGSLALRLACSPCKASPAELLPLTLARLLVERATYKISSFQNIRSARLILALQSSQRNYFLCSMRSLWLDSPHLPRPNDFSPFSPVRVFREKRDRAIQRDLDSF